MASKTRLQSLVNLNSENPPVVAGVFEELRRREVRLAEEDETVLSAVGIGAS